MWKAVPVRRAESKSGREATSVRQIAAADAEQLAALQSADREILRRWEPERHDDYFTPDGQRTLIMQLLDLQAVGRCLPLVIQSDGRLIGRLTIREIAGRPVHKATLGYWVADSDAGRGHAGRAVAEGIRRATQELGLHRLEASTQVANEASQRVLRRNGFQLMGVAHDHIFTAGRWHDELLWERLLDSDASPDASGEQR